MLYVLMLDVEGGKEPVWDDIVKMCFETEGDVDPLYATRCVTHGDISLIMDIKDTDKIIDFINHKLIPLGGLRDMWMFSMMNPRFFPIPKEVTQTEQAFPTSSVTFTSYAEYKPFTVTLDCQIDKYEEIYEAISKIQPTEDVILTYLAYAFQSFEDDIVLSLLGKDIYTVDQFVIDHIRSIEGVFDTKTYAISRVKVLTSLQNWHNYINKYSYTQDVIVTGDTPFTLLDAYTIAF